VCKGRTAVFNEMSEAGRNKRKRTHLKAFIYLLVTALSDCDVKYQFRKISQKALI